MRGQNDLGGSSMLRTGFSHLLQLDVPYGAPHLHQLADVNLLRRHVAHTHFVYKILWVYLSALIDGPPTMRREAPSHPKIRTPTPSAWLLLVSRARRRASIALAHLVSDVAIILASLPQTKRGRNVQPWSTKSNLFCGNLEPKWPRSVVVVVLTTL